MATHKSAEPNNTTPQEPAMPRPPELPKVPEAGTMSPAERSNRVLRNFARLARGMANTSPQRGDALGPVWHELACDLEAQCTEAGVTEPSPATSDRPLELRPLASASVPTMLHGPSAVDPMQLQILAALDAIAKKLG